MRNIELPDMEFCRTNGMVSGAGLEAERAPDNPPNLAALRAEEARLQERINRLRAMLDCGAMELADLVARRSDLQKQIGPAALLNLSVS